MESFEFDGIEEWIEALSDAAKRYPDLAEDTLKKEQKAFRSAMIKETWRAAERKTGNLVKGYRFDKIHTYRGMMETNFHAEGGKKNAHFHLINNGHEIVLPRTRRGKPLKNGGKVVGFVPGRRIKEPVIARWEEEHVKRADRMLRRICEEADK